MLVLHFHNGQEIKRFKHRCNVLKRNKKSVRIMRENLSHNTSEGNKIHRGI